jgi:drug/metabolite transporter (DMT)-like permease
MVQGFLFLTGTIIAWTGTGIFYKRAGEKQLPIIPLGLLLSLFGTIGAFFISGAKPAVFTYIPDYPLFFLVMAAAGIINQVAMLLNAIAMQRGAGSITWAIFQSSLVIPFLFAVTYWNESVVVFQWIGLVMIVGTIVLQARLPEQLSEEHRRVHISWLLLTLLCFALNGIQQVLFIVPSHVEEWSFLYRYRVFVGQTASLFFFLILVLLGKWKIRLRKNLVALPLTACVIIGQTLFLEGADILTHHGISAIAFPFVIGSIIVLFALFNRFARHEPISAIQWAGIGAGVVGVVLISLY